MYFTLLKTSLKSQSDSPNDFVDDLLIMSDDC